MSKVYNALKKAEREGRWQPGKPGETIETAETVETETAETETLATETAETETLAGAALAADALEADALEADALEADARERDGRELPAAPPAFDSAPNGAARRAADLTTNGLVERPLAPRELPPPPAAPPPAVRAHGRLSEWWRMLTQTDVRPDNDAPMMLLGNAVAMARAAEQFHLLRVWFENWTTAHQKRVIMMSSALSGEGKSFVSLNLAVTLATAGYRVLLVDADLRRPCLHRSLNLVPLRGLLDFLEDRADFAGCLTQVAALPTLTLVAAGGVTTNAAELMASRRMGEFLAAARALEPPHYILIDAPAALATPEAEILASLVDAALLVIAANHTPRQMVKDVFRLLKKTTTCGVVLNRFEAAFSNSRKMAYGYYGQTPDQSPSGLH